MATCITCGRVGLQEYKLPGKGMVLETHDYPDNYPHLVAKRLKQGCPHLMLNCPRSGEANVLPLEKRSKKKPQIQSKKASASLESRPKMLVEDLYSSPHGRSVRKK